MSVKRILRVYFDKPNYVKPKEVSKAFKLFNKRGDLQDKLKDHLSKNERIDTEGEIAEVEEELKLVMNVICPKEGNWKISYHKEGDNRFAVITITQRVEDELSFKSQEEEIDE